MASFELIRIGEKQGCPGFSDPPFRLTRIGIESVRFSGRLLNSCPGYRVSSRIGLGRSDRN